MHKLPEQLYKNWEAKDTLEKYLPKDINRIILDYVYEPINLLEYNIIHSNDHSVRATTKLPIIYINSYIKEYNFLLKYIKKPIYMHNDRYTSYVIINKKAVSMGYMFVIDNKIINTEIIDGQHFKDYFYKDFLIENLIK